MRIHARIAIALSLVAAAALSACAGDKSLPPSSTPVGPTPVPPAPAETVTRGITYCERDGTALKMDVYRPDAESDQLPAVLFLHAGAWVLGSKLTIGGIIEFGDVLERGYVVASIDYGLAPDFMFPEQLENANCAVRYMRAESEQHGIDPERIAVWGASAGGHLAALMGAAGPDAGFEAVGGHEDESSEVQAVVDLFGPADLQMPDYVPNADEISRVVFGAPGAGPSEALERASPVTYVSDDDPPFLIIHGDADGVVPLAQSQALAMELEAAGVPVTFVVVKGGKHGLTPGDAVMAPTSEQIQAMIGDFLDTHLAASGEAVSSE